MVVALSISPFLFLNSHSEIFTHKLEVENCALRNAVLFGPMRIQREGPAGAYRCNVTVFSNEFSCFTRVRTTQCEIYIKKMCTLLGLDRMRARRGGNGKRNIKTCVCFTMHTNKTMSYHQDCKYIVSHSFDTLDTSIARGIVHRINTPREFFVLNCVVSLQLNAYLVHCLV